MTLLPLERSSPTDATVEALRDEILGGAYLPGTAIPDEEVQARLGVPRDHARTALARLEREGLLVHSLHRGLEVVRISVDDVRDLYATRRTLELAGLEAMVRRRPADDVCVWLQAANQSMTEAAKAGDGRAAVAADAAFHLAIVASTSSRRLRTAAEAALEDSGSCWRSPTGSLPISTSSPPTTSACSTRSSMPRPVGAGRTARSPAARRVARARGDARRLAASSEVRPALERRDCAVIAADQRTVAVEGVLAPQKAVEGRARHRDRRICRRAGGMLGDGQRDAVAGRDVPGARRQLGDFLRDGEDVAAGPLRRDRERQRAVDEPRLEPGAGPDRVGE